MDIYILSGVDEIEYRIDFSQTLISLYPKLREEKKNLRNPFVSMRIFCSAIINGKESITSIFFYLRY